MIKSSVVLGEIKNIRVLYGAASILTLIAGFCIYLLFRDTDNIILFELMPKPGFIKSIFISLAPSVFSAFIKYHLPDMLWFLSAILFFRFYWFYNLKVQKIYILCLYAAGILLETSQLSKNFPGTFDWLDLLFMCIAAFVESFLYIFLIRRRYV